MKNKSPSDFTKFPFGSAFNKCEYETIAQNIMVILKRTGNKFRHLTWNEYKTERLKDGDFSDGERTFFEEVIDYCKSEDTAKLFSKEWN
jgi:hypothetical protein